MQIAEIGGDTSGIGTTPWLGTFKILRKAQKIQFQVPWSLSYIQEQFLIANNKTPSPKCHLFPQKHKAVIISIHLSWTLAVADPVLAEILAPEFKILGYGTFFFPL